MDSRPSGPVHSTQQTYQQLTPQQIIDSMPSLILEERAWLMQNQHLLTRPETVTRLQAAYYEAADKKIDRGSPEYFRLFDDRLSVSSNRSHLKSASAYCP